MRRLAALALGTAVGLTGLTGCSAPQTPIEAEYAGLDQSILADNAAEVVKCVKEKTGFDVTAGSDGSVSYSAAQVPVDQSDIVDAAIPACFEELGFMTDGQLSRPQLEHLYQLELVAQACLAGKGYETSPAPSQQVFLDTWGTPDLWAPWAEMGKYQLSSEDFADLLAQCPDPASFPAG